MKSIRFTVRNYYIDVAGFPEAKLVGILSYLISTGVFRSAAAVVREFTDLDDLEIARLHDPTKPSTERQPPQRKTSGHGYIIRSIETNIPTSP
ncbi:hypothetical protein BFJ70_g16767 [Fusarium oxysporum]|nr:hypothetical protein BFJ70_g16767 [Fusarium oxysporum]